MWNLFKLWDLSKFTCSIKSNPVKSPFSQCTWRLSHWVLIYHKSTQGTVVQIKILRCSPGRPCPALAKWCGWVQVLQNLSRVRWSFLDSVNDFNFLPSAHRAQVRKAMDYITSLTPCVTFVPAQVPNYDQCTGCAQYNIWLQFQIMTKSFKTN